MNILVYALLIPSERRRSFVQRLEEVQRQGHSVTVCTVGDRTEIDSSLDIRRMPQWDRSLSVLSPLNALLYMVFGIMYGLHIWWQDGIDIVRADFADVPGVTGAFLSTLIGKPFIVYCHGRNHLNDPLDSHEDRRRVPYTVLHPGNIRYWMVKASLARADTVFVVSELYGRAFDCETTVMYPSVDTERFKPGTSPDDRVVSVALLYASKNLQTAIPAAESTGYAYDIIGDGPFRDELETIASSTRFLGPGGTDAVATELASSKLFLLPSRYETFGIAYLEAMAAGCPIICGRDTGVAEIIDDGVHGVIVDPDDDEAIVDAIAFIDRHIGQLSAAARARAEEFATVASAASMIAQYQTLLPDA